jgi:hypothetical protein
LARKHKQLVKALQMPGQALEKDYCSTRPAVEQGVLKVVLDQAWE